MQSLPQVLEQRLVQWDLDGRMRFLSGQKGIDFSSNDYLGFAQDQTLRSLILQSIQCSEVLFGSTGSRLLRGNSALFEEVEAELGEFCSQESALIYSSGFQANFGVLSALLRETDHVFSDLRNHASLIDGIRLSRAQKKIYSAFDLAGLEKNLREVQGKDALKLIVTESIFGMDGVKAPLLELVELAEKYQAHVFVDEAHATGIWGDFRNHRGGGLVQSLGLSSRVLATVHTAGKALGLGGAWVACSKKLKSYFLQASRPMMFSTAPMPIMPLSFRVALKYWKSVGMNRAHQVIEKSDELARILGKHPQSIPVILYQVGENAQAMTLALSLQKVGYDVRAIRPPTVPEGTARLRICVHANHSLDELEGFASKLIELSASMNLRNQYQR